MYLLSAFVESLPGPVPLLHVNLKEFVIGLVFLMERWSFLVWFMKLTSKWRGVGVESLVWVFLVWNQALNHPTITWWLLNVHVSFPRWL